MASEWTEADREYHAKVTHAVLSAVVMANAEPGQPGGAIDLPVAYDAMVTAIATLAHKSGNYTNARDRRLFGEEAGRAIAKYMRNIADKDARGELAAWNLEPIGTPN